MGVQAKGSGFLMRSVQFHEGSNARTLSAFPVAHRAGFQDSSFGEILFLELGVWLGDYRFEIRFPTASQQVPHGLISWTSRMWDEG